MGAHPADYERLAPPRSFLHVDWFESPAHLARVLHALDADPALYARLHAWRRTHANFDTRYWCRICFAAHLLRRERLSVHYADAHTWLRNFVDAAHTENLCIGKRRWLQRALDEPQLRDFLGLTISGA